MLHIVHLIQYISQLFDLPLLWHLSYINIKFTFLKRSIDYNLKTLSFFLFFYFYIYIIVYNLLNCFTNYYVDNKLNLSSTFFIRSNLSSSSNSSDYSSLNVF